MNGTIEHIAPPRMSFFDKAAWYVLFTPLAYIALAVATSLILNRFQVSASTMDSVDQTIILGALLVELLSCIFAFVICCAIRHHTKKFTILLALLSILVNCGLGYFTFIGLAMSNLGHNC